MNDIWRKTPVYWQPHLNRARKSATLVQAISLRYFGGRRVWLSHNSATPTSPPLARKAHALGESIRDCGLGRPYTRKKLENTA